MICLFKENSAGLNNKFNPLSTKGENMDIYKSYEETEYFLQEFLKAPQKAQQIMLIPLVNLKCYPTIMCEEIKSPIEQIFITAFDLYQQDKKDHIFLFSQAEIKIKKKKYFADFLFECDEYVNNYTTNKKIIIECDGYEFHQKTKEQVQHDNEREYDLKMAGYEVLRFSGTQIFNNPIKCAEDTYNYIFKRIKEDSNGKEENGRS